MSERVFFASIILVAALAGSPSLAQPSRSPTGPEGGAVGDPNGSIRSLGAAGYNDSGKNSSAVVIPHIDMGRREVRGLPWGTTGPRRW